MASLLQRIRRRITSAVLESQMRLFERAATAGDLFISRRAAVPDDAVSPERATPITYELVIKAGRQRTTLGRLTWNPDPDQVVEPLGMADQPGPVTDRMLRAAILTGALRETRRSARGEDPDVEHVLQLGAGGTFQTRWTPKAPPTPGR